MTVWSLIDTCCLVLSFCGHHISSTILYQKLNVHVHTRMRECRCARVCMSVHRKASETRTHLPIYLRNLSVGINFLFVHNRLDRICHSIDRWRNVGEYGVCDKTVRRIAQNGDAIKTMLKYSSNSGRCHVAVNLQFPEINESVYEWFCGKQERCGNFPITDEIVKTYATRLATRLKISEFKASNGWLRSWKSRYNIALRKVSPLVLF
jgi:hypothetical protein